MGLEKIREIVDRMWSQRYDAEAKYGITYDTDMMDDPAREIVCPIIVDLGDLAVLKDAVAEACDKAGL